METLLISGVNTRPLAEAAYELGYKVYSTSYFHTIDFKLYHKEKHIQIQKPNKSCGTIQENYNPLELEKITLNWIDDVDKIILYTGISPENIPNKKIIGNKKTEHIENKYKLYKKIHKYVNTPKTYLIKDLDEIIEIQKQNPKKEYLIKPITGTGGYGVQKLTPKLINKLKKMNIPKKTLIQQEYIKGTPISVSILATKTETKTLTNSQQLIGTDGRSENKYIYQGNISPQIENNNEANNISEKLIKKLKLIGSNGVDLIQTPNETKVIEVNPRIQGTFECIQESLNINMLNAHILACQNELIDIPQIKKYSIKKIIYAKEKTKILPIKSKNIHDIPLKNTIIEKGEPIVTIVTNGHNIKEAKMKLKQEIEYINTCLKPIQ